MVSASEQGSFSNSGVRDQEDADERSSLIGGTHHAFTGEGSSQNRIALMPERSGPKSRWPQAGKEIRRV